VKREMDYFSAVQQGRTRVKQAVEVLTEVAGPSYPVLFLKTDGDGWTPVGEENLCAVVSGKNGTAAVVLCDSDGNAKAISGWVSRSEAERFSSALASKGLSPYVGDVKLPV
jgi:hypothetical protein